MYDVHWGLPVIGYLFLAGVGGGALTVSATTLLRANGTSREEFNIARFGAFLAPLPLIIGTGMIIFELGTFEAALATGNYALLFKWINLFLTINLSPMSIGSWVLAFCILASLAYAMTFLGKGAGLNDDWADKRRLLAWFGVPLGLAVAMYTAIMLGATPARPLWNTPMLVFLFLFSSLSTGVAGILLLKAIFGGKAETAEGAQSSYRLAASDTVLIGLELVAVVLFVLFAHLTVGNMAHAIAVILPGGAFAPLFWGGVVVIGLLLPAAVELFYVIPTLRGTATFAMPRGLEIAVCAAILLGGFILRYVVVVAGQVTGPVGL